MSVTQLESRSNLDETGLRWDWYQATVKDHGMAINPNQLVDLLGKELHASGQKVDRGLHGYESQTVLMSAEGDALARVLHGGRNRWPNAWGSGEHATRFADVMRMQFPDRHLVTRADVAHDVQAPDAFDQLLKKCLEVADDRHLNVSHAGDWHRAEKGRTLYIGSRKSEQFIRLYEKGLEQRGKAPTPEAAEAIPDDWTRLELVAKPQKAHRRALLAAMEPADVFGVAIWTRQLADAVLALDVPRIERASWTRADDAVALDWMIRQYGSVLLRQVEMFGGDWESLGRKIGRMVERQAERKNGIRADESASATD